MRESVMPSYYERFLIIWTRDLLGFVCFPYVFLVVSNLLILLNKSVFLSLAVKRGLFLF